MTQEKKARKRKLKIKPIISESYSLLDFLPDYNVFDIYLAYVRTRGYILINYSGSRYWFKSFESNYDPENLYKNYGNESEEENYIELINTIMDYLKPYAKYLEKELNKFPYEIREEIENIALTVLDSLIEDVKDKYLTDSFLSVGRFKNNQMKHFILNPVETFNEFLTNAEEYSLTGDRAFLMETEFYEQIDDLIKDFNSKLNYYVPEEQPDGSIIKKPVFDKKDFYEAFIDVVNNVFPSNIFKLKTGGSKLNKTEGALELASEFNMKRTLKNENEVVYYYNESYRYYEEITSKGLKNLIYNTYGFNLADSDIRAMFKSIPFEDKLYKNILVFNNCLFDTDTLEKVKGVYNRRDYLTLNRIGYKEKGSSKINLLDYDNGLESLEVEDILVEKAPEDAETLVEKTLREILIPKNNPKDLSLYQDYLERTGAKIFGRNLFKGITFYDTRISNTGKTIILYLWDLLYNDKNISIDAGTLEDKFSFKSYDNALALNIDETDNDSFENVKPEIKRISSQYSKMQYRNMREESQYVIEEFPELTIASNVKLKLDPIDDYAIFERVDFLRPPNRFVAEKEVKNYDNAYAKNDNLFNELREDRRGLNWLITASIKCLKDMIENNKRYCCKQTAEESIDIYLDGNNIKKFLVVYTEKAPDLIPSDYVHIKTIKEEFLRYVELKGITLSQQESNNLSKDIGKELSKLYDISKNDGKLRDSIGYKYAIKLKSLEDVAIEFKYVYAVNEELTDADLYKFNNLTSDERLIYKSINEDGLNTINLLNKSYVGLDVLSCVRSLEEKNLIVNTFETNLDDY